MEPTPLRIELFLSLSGSNYATIKCYACKEMLMIQEERSHPEIYEIYTKYCDDHKTKCKGMEETPGEEN